MKKYASRHGAVMVEPVIIITFFAVISVFLLRMFASTEKVRSSADEMSKAVIRAESVMEYILAEDVAVTESLIKLGFKTINADDKVYYVKYYDKKWQESEAVGPYNMTVLVDAEEMRGGTMYVVDLKVGKYDILESGEHIYELSAKKYSDGRQAE
ncbi:MAG: hypothetical protein K6G60_04980 [Lachnospiraceae bacterium]|nr:hypothetical protein [Lachnospiraceae bacterium]